MSEQGDAYTTYIDSVLTGEFDRRDKINSQANSTLTSAGGFLTVSSALIVFLKGENFLPHGRAPLVFVVALGLYLASGILAVCAAMARPVQVIDIGPLRDMVSGHWTDTEVTAKNFVARIKLDAIESLSRSNQNKAMFLVAASISQVSAVAAVALAVYVTLR